MKLSRSWTLFSALVLVFFFTLTGCGGPGVARITGLSPDKVVQTFYDAAKSSKMNEAALYVASESRSAGTDELGSLQNMNLLSVRKVAEQGDYAVVIATLQQQNSINISVKPVGLEKKDGEWYIVDINSIYQNAKYSILASLLSKL